MAKFTKEKVFKVAIENQVLENSIVSNEVYAKQGYRIIHYSITSYAGTIPERYASPCFVIVESGEATFAYRDENGETQTVNLKQGFGILRPAHTLGCYKTEGSSAIITEYILHKDSDLSLRLQTGKPFELREMVCYEPGQVSRAQLIRDEHFRLTLKAYSESEKHNRVSKYVTQLLVLEGKLCLDHESSHYELYPGDFFVLPKDYSYTIHIFPHTKAEVLYIAE